MRFIVVKFVLISAVIFCWDCVDGANILGVFPAAGKSLNILSQRLMRGLAEAGHDVTVISAIKNGIPVVKGSYTDVLLTGFAEKYEKLLEEHDFFATPEDYPLSQTRILHDMLVETFNNTLHHPNVKKFLEEDHKFDLVITEYLWGDAMLVFGTIYQCPLALFASMGGAPIWQSDMMGNPLPISYVPHAWMLGEFSKGMTFFQRVHNLLFYLSDVYTRETHQFPIQNEILRSVFPNPPDAADMYGNVSFVLLGSHSSTRQAIPFAPNIVEIGGFHIDPPKKPPKDLQEFFDNDKEGVIFFSMGSHVKSKDFSPERKQTMLNVFRKLKMKVLWKFEDEKLPGKPDNVLIRKWVPQMDILGHPNLKLFITHGGYGSTLETIYHGKPALMIPVFLDQFNNANQAAAQGYALKIAYSDPNFNEATLSSLLHELLNNPKYKEKAQHISRIFHDRPMKPLDTAIYWLEYVIRHKGANHLKLAAVKMPWYQLYMVDVLLFFVSIFSIFVVLLWLLVKLLFGLGGKSQKVKTN